MQQNIVKLSIITVVYNAVDTLEETILSVFSQNMEEIEYIVIDGASNDGSVDVIKKYDKQLSYWISEPDRGVFDAMNKGIDRSRGEWVYFLGADDVLMPDVINKILTKLEHPLKLVFGDVLFDDGHVMKSSLTIRTLMQNTVHHQGAFYNKTLFDGFRYDQRFKSQADYELNLLVYLRKYYYLYCPILVARYATCGISAGHSNQALDQINKIRTKHIHSKTKRWFFSCILQLYYWQKQLRFWLKQR